MSSWYCPQKAWIWVGVVGALLAVGTVMASPPAATIVWVASSSGTKRSPTGTSTVTSAPVSLLKKRLSAGPK